MKIELCAIGGFSKTEGNSVAIKVGDEVVILDMGLSMENYVRYTEDREEISSKNYSELLRVDAVPDYDYIKDWKKQVKAIVPSHAHLDHIGAIPFAASLFGNVPIISTPYTKEVIQSIVQDEKILLANPLISVQLNSSYKISKNFRVEFVNVTHSIPHAAIVVLHTPAGKVVYANDFKLDRHPTLGPKPNFKRLEQLGKEGIDILIMNCLYVQKHTHCPSESVAREMLRDVLLGMGGKEKGLIITTFSSHIARLKSILELGKKLNRKVVFLGRSLAKYVEAAERIQLVNFSKEVKIIRYRDKIEDFLDKVEKEGKEKYLIVCTGHQGEPKAVLARIARGELDFKLDSNDIVIFSCNVIPVEINEKNREKLEGDLEGLRVRIFKEIHVSGHAHREDLREMLELLRPKELIPIHAEKAKGKMLAELARQVGIKNTKVLEDGEFL